MLVLEVPVEASEYVESLVGDGREDFGIFSELLVNTGKETPVIVALPVGAKVEVDGRPQVIFLLAILRLATEAEVHAEVQGEFARVRQTVPIEQEGGVAEGCRLAGVCNQGPVYLGAEVSTVLVVDVPLETKTEIVVLKDVHVKTFTVRGID